MIILSRHTSSFYQKDYHIFPLPIKKDTVQRNLGQDWKKTKMKRADNEEKPNIIID